MTSETARPVGYPTRRDAYYVAFIVFTATAFSFLDRQVLAILVDPIRHDLQVSDTRMSLLYGFAFVILYSTLGLPIGRLIDRSQRRLILAAGVATWSVMTIACGLAHDYWTLFAARIGVGVGEACLTPAACSLLADCFEPRVRGRAMSVYLLGVYVGLGLSMAVGGALYEALRRGVHLPFIGALAPWRAVFVLIGAPGLLIAALAPTMREPPRQDLAAATGGGAPADDANPGLVRYLRLNASTIATALAAHGLLAFVSYALMGWAPSVLVRQFHQPRAAVGLTLGVLSLVGGVVGALWGSIVSDRWTAQGMTAAKFRVCAIGAGFAAVGLTILPFATAAWTAFAAITLCLTALPFASASGQTMVQELFPNRLRGQGSAMMVLLMGLFGAGGGPLAVGLLSDTLLRRQGLSVAIVSTGLPAAIAVLLLYLLGRDAYEAARRRVKRQAEPTAPSGLLTPRSHPA
ncbi:MAG: MFS transporter [Caulobacteraceae bacterium]|nr:MFS transporter [Caulobacteraceae bacterium]